MSEIAPVKAAPLETLGTPVETLVKRVELQQPLTKQKEAMSEKRGVKQTKDIVRAARVLTLEILSETLDGVSPMDAVRVVMDSEVRSTVAEAIEGIEEVDDEVADLSTEEIFEIVREGVDFSEDVLAKVLE